ncbi:MAG TPA: hypothetical protein VFH78_12205 [Candidatus Thermoplasmatota archaeon]|nr:hypothetical protein [Candidatus Thermoplasmatota archaeon]
MLDAMKEQLERQVARLLEEAERPMRVEEILPHLDPVMPTPNDVADVLQGLAQKQEVDREGSYFGKATPVPIDHLFTSERQRNAAREVVDIIRGIDERSGEGARVPAVVKAALARGLEADRVLDAVTVLRNAGEVYSVGGDRIRVAKGGATRATS